MSPDEPTRDPAGPDDETVDGPGARRAGPAEETADGGGAQGAEETVEPGAPSPATASPDDETVAARIAAGRSDRATHDDATVDRAPAVTRAAPDDETLRRGPQPIRSGPDDETVTPPGREGETVDSRPGPTDETVDAVPTRGSTPTRSGSARAVGSPSAPAFVGGYRIEGELARGGVGVVYVAHDPKLERRVALKLLRAGEGATPTQLERFRREARAASRLRHRHLISVHEVGEAGGQSFLVMDLVPGSSLAQRIEAEGPLDPREAARLAQQLAAALQHAHEHAILHRDVKPGNVLVDDEGQACLTDFGLAKEVEGEQGVTITGEVVGTPAYMAPEQADGELARIDRRADVYGLGATLYAMLTGRPPFRAGSVLATLEQVRRDEPASPRSLRPELERDLETICLRCLEKEPSERYPTAGAVAAELERYLDDRPIEARPPGLLDRGRKWLRRNRSLAAVSAGLIGVAGLVIVVGSVWFSLQLRAALAAAESSAETARDQADRARAAERAAADEAEHARRVSHAALMTLSKLALELREELDRLPGPGARRLEDRLVKLIRADVAELRELGVEGSQVTGLEVLLAHELGGAEGRAARLRALERARALLASYPSGAPIQQTLAARQLLCRCLDAVGDDLRNAGDLGAAEGVYAEALERRRGMLAQLQTAGVQRALGVSLRAMGLLREDQGRLRDARALYREWVDVTCAVEILEPERSKRRLERCRAQVKLASLEAELGRFEASAAALEPAARGLAELLAQRPGDPEARRLLGIAHEVRSELAQARGDTEQALTHQAQAVVEARRLVRMNPGDEQATWDLARHLDELGTQQSNAGQRDAARASREESAGLFDALAAADPGNVYKQEGRASAIAQLATLALEAGELEAAERGFQEAIDLLSRLLLQRPDSHTLRFNLGVYRWHLAKVAEAAGDAERAVRLLCEAAETFRPLAEATPPSAEAVFEEMRIWRDVYHLEAGRIEPALALEHAREGLRWARRYHEVSPSAHDAVVQLGNSLFVVATLAQEAGAFAEGLAAIEEARRDVEARLAVDDSDLTLFENRAVFLSVESQLLGALGRHAEAMQQAERAFEHQYRVSQRDPRGSMRLRILVWRQLELLGQALLDGVALDAELREQAHTMLGNYASIDATERRALRDLRPTVDADGQRGIDAQFREHREKVELLRSDPRWEALRADGSLQQILDDAGL